MEFLAVAGFLSGATSLLFTFRKDALHIRLDLSDVEYDGVVLGVNNESGVPFCILSVGCFDSSGQVTWISRVGEYVSNQYIDYPIRVEPRSLRSILLIAPRDVPQKSQAHGYCVQLETGRIYVLRNTAPTAVCLRLQLASLASRLSRGAWAPGVASRPRLPTRALR